MISFGLSGKENHFPAVLSLVDEYPNLRLLLDISSDLAWFRGHFPGTPILAGVVQLHWAVSVSLALFKFKEVPVEIRRLKFKSVVTPPRSLMLELNKIGDKEVQFEFSSQGQIHSLGRLIFEEEASC